ncbi:methyltransferase domain-containing protein [Thermodesulfobacteriota bacterium]
MNRCLICNTSIEPFMSFGPMPIANGFLSPDRFADEYFFELQVVFCPDCGMVQLSDPVDPEKMFHENYAFFSSTSTGMAAHFKQLAGQLLRDHLQTPDSFVVEIGSNDGIMLQHLAKAGLRHLGIEPSRNVARKAMDKGIRTLCKFFDEGVAREILAQNGPADVVVGANVMCHIPQLHTVLAGIKTLLKPNGVLIFEDPYLGDIVEKTSYDQIYDEHVFYFSLKSINHLVEQHGLEVVDVIPLGVHGGSMRYVVAHQGTRTVSASVAGLQAKEAALGLHRSEAYQRLHRNIERSREDLMQLLHALKRQKKRVVGYGATSKSTTVTNYCGINSGLVEFISDTTPIKQGKFSPGTHIPVRPYEEFVANYPDYALLFAWNHAGEIMAKEQNFRRAGGQWLVYVPKVEVLK